MTETCEALSKMAARHTSEQFLTFLINLVANQPTGKAIHVIADNLSAHKTKRVTEFLQPTYRCIRGAPVASIVSASS